MQHCYDHAGQVDGAGSHCLAFMITRMSEFSANLLIVPTLLHVLSGLGFWVQDLGFPFCYDQYSCLDSLYWHPSIATTPPKTDSFLCTRAATTAAAIDMTSAVTEPLPAKTNAFVQPCLSGSW